jgi:prepilin-type N-terminal cleavage/methylation domain-containing protein
MELKPTSKNVIPAKAGIQKLFRLLDSRLRGSEKLIVIRGSLGNKGFTLIEMIILIVMAGILLPAIIVPFVSSVKGSGKPEMATTAMFLAHEKMEEFMQFDYTDATLNSVALTLYADADAVNFPGYQWQWEIVTVDNNLNTSGTDLGYKRILVRIRDPMGDTYELYSVIADFQ